MRGVASFDTTAFDRNGFDKLMRILILTQWFDPEPTFKGLIFAKALKIRGHEVEVITGFPNYPSGKVYPGYRLRPIHREIIDGIRINRVFLYPSHDSSTMRRLLNYASFCVSSCLFGIFGTRRADVLYVYHPPLFVGLSGSLISIFRRVPMVYDVQDLWPDTLRATGMVKGKLILGVLGRLCRWVYGRAKSIVVLSPGFKRLLIERGVPADKIDVIYNWCSEEPLSGLGKGRGESYGMDGYFNVVFAGNIGPAQALDSVLRAASLVQAITKEIQFVFVGDGIALDSLKSLVNDEHLENVIFVPRLPHSRIGDVLQRATVLLVHLKKDPLFEITIPSKTQAYLAAGKPVLMAVKGDAAELVARAGAGLYAEPESPESIARAALAMIEMSKGELLEMGARGKEFYYRELSLERGTARFLDVFRAACNSNARSDA